MTHALFQQFIARNTWIFAKTYSTFCPHEYIVKSRLSNEEKAAFEQIVSFIRESGFEAIYGNLGPNQYYTVDDYYYWTMGAPIEQTTILNRAKHSDYDFVPIGKGLFVQYKRINCVSQAPNRGNNSLKQLISLPKEPKSNTFTVRQGGGRTLKDELPFSANNTSELPV